MVVAPELLLDNSEAAAAAACRISPFCSAEAEAAAEGEEEEAAAAQPMERTWSSAIEARSLQLQRQ